MGDDECGGTACGKVLAHFPCIVGREGGLPVYFLVPVRKLCDDFGLRRPEAFFVGHQKQPQPTPELLLRLRVEHGAELFNGLVLHLEVLVKMDTVGLHPEVEPPLLGKIIACHQLLRQRAGNFGSQLIDQLLLCQLFCLLAALGVDFLASPAAAEPVCPQHRRHDPRRRGSG